MTAIRIGRRAMLLAPLAASLAASLAAPAVRAADTLPVIFVHGNGDTAGLWLTTLWRFESNGYPADRLFALDLRTPQAGAAFDKPQAGRSGGGNEQGPIETTGPSCSPAELQGALAPSAISRCAWSRQPRSLRHRSFSTGSRRTR